MSCFLIFCLCLYPTGNLLDVDMNLDATAIPTTAISPENCYEKIGETFSEMTHQTGDYVVKTPVANSE